VYIPLGAAAWSLADTSSIGRERTSLDQPFAGRPKIRVTRNLQAQTACDATAQLGGLVIIAGLRRDDPMSPAVIRDFLGCPHSICSPCDMDVHEHVGTAGERAGA